MSRPDRVSSVLAVPVLLGPAALAFTKGGYFDEARLTAGVVACALVAVVAVAVPQPLPRDGAGRVALLGLAALTAWVGASIAWAPIAGPASDDLQRLLLYLAAFTAALAVLRPPSVRRLVELVLLAGIVCAALYGLSERLLPGVFALTPLPSAANRLAWPLTYWNAMGALTGLGLVLAASLRRPWAAATAPVLGLCCYLAFSRGALGATAAGLAVLVALAPSRERLRAAVIAVAAAAVPAAATIALPAVKAPGGSAGQGAAMLAVLAIAGAAAAALTGRGTTPPADRGSPTAPEDTSSPVAAADRDAAAILERDSSPRDAPVRGARVAALTLLALAVGVTLFAATRAERHGGTAATGASASRLVSAQSNRYEYWRVAVREFRGEPLRGGGSGSFRTEWLRERPFAESVRDAHSLYLETAAELGIVGLAALGVFLGGVAATARNALHREGAQAAGAVAALVVWAVHAGLDWDWEMPALTLVALVLAARLAPGDAAPAP